MILDQDELKHLAVLTNGRCGILLNSGYPKSQSEPDINELAGGETVQAFGEPLPISDQAAMIPAQWPNSSVEVKIRNFFRQLFLSNELQQRIASLTKWLSKTLE